ncbi:MAG TPA: glycerol-3-phosphate 1-O-acyltransferase PlsY [Candidatus Omnitrophota bacterium]|nr:glycerol-3-phosphate 1-O-acyltransferase PlsY [Candidatus Omnitrophota bacterium]
MKTGLLASLDHIFFYFPVMAYFIGTIPFGLLIARWVRGIDIRDHGSKNIGATNVFRVVGKKWGILVFLLDTLKGVFACVFPRFWGAELSMPLQLMLGLMGILGHSFPVWLKFRGGKGVATSLGVFLAISWVPTLTTFLIWMLAFMFCRIISLCSLIAAVFFPIAIVSYYWGTKDLPFLLPISLVLASFIFYTHRTNIQRLRQGTEKRLF